MRDLQVVAFVMIVFGSALATGALPVVDEIGSTGAYLAPADSEAGQKYVSMNEDDEMQMQIEVNQSSEQVDLGETFVVGLSSEAENQRPIEVQVENADGVVELYRADNPGTGSNVVNLDPGERATFGVRVDAENPGTFTEDMTISVGEVGNDGTGGTGGGGGIDNPDTDDSTDDSTNDASETEQTDEDTGPSDVDNPSDVDEDNGPMDIDNPSDDDDGPSEVDNPSDDGGPTTGGVGPLGPTSIGNVVDPGGPTLEPGGFGFGLGPFAVPWLLLSALLAAISNYLVQTRLRDEEPIMETDEEIRRERAKHIAAAEGRLVLVVLAMELILLQILFSLGIEGMVVVTAIQVLFAIAAGAVPGYYYVPDLFPDDLGEVTDEPLEEPGKPEPGFNDDDD